MKTIYFIPLVALFLVSLVFNGCGTSKDTGKNADLGGTEWVLFELDGVKYEPAAGKEITIKFDDTKMNAGGKSSCNTYGAGYQSKENKLTFTGVFSTKMACDDMEAEIKYLNVLPKTFAYQTTGNLLYFFDSGGMVILRFKMK